MKNPNDFLSKKRSLTPSDFVSKVNVEDPQQDKNQEEILLNENEMSRITIKTESCKSASVVIMSSPKSPNAYSSANSGKSKRSQTSKNSKISKSSKNSKISKNSKSSKSSKKSKKSKNSEIHINFLNNYNCINISHNYDQVEFLKSLSYILQGKDYCTACAIYNNKIYVTCKRFGAKSEKTSSQYQLLEKTIQSLSNNNFDIYDVSTYKNILEIMISNIEAILKCGESFLFEGDKEREMLEMFLLNYFKQNEIQSFINLRMVTMAMRNEKIKERIKKFVKRFFKVIDSPFRKLLRDSEIVFYGTGEMHSEIKLVYYLLEKFKIKENSDNKIYLAASLKPCKRCYIIMSEILKNKKKINLAFPNECSFVEESNFSLPKNLKDDQESMNLLEKIYNETQYEKQDASYGHSMIEVKNQENPESMSILYKVLQENIKYICEHDKKAKGKIKKILKEI